MRHSKRWIAVLGLLVAVSPLSACTQTSAEGSSEKEEPAKVEQAQASGVSRLTLTAKAVERLGVQTTPLREVTIAGKLRKVVPYGALMYDKKGETWVYVSPSANVYVREQVSVELIQENRAILTSGPAAGTAVVSVGAAELYGTETGVGH
jgi:hypothetical protein